LSFVFSSQFPVYVYRLKEQQDNDDLQLYNQLVAAVKLTGQLVSDPDRACVYLVPLSSSSSSVKNVATLPTRLSHWQGDGRNHILVINPIKTTPETSGGLKLSPSETSGGLTKISRALLLGRFIIAQQEFSRAAFRRGFDLVLPVLGGQSAAGPVWADYPSMVPIVRDYLLYFSGEQNATAAAAAGASSPPAVADSLKEDAMIVQELEKLQKTAGGTSDRFRLSFHCDQKISHDDDAPVPWTDWRLCDEVTTRLAAQKEATFSLILPPSDHQGIVSSRLLQQRLYEALKVPYTVEIVASANFGLFCGKHKLL
jgi:Exostosin family